MGHTQCEAAHTTIIYARPSRTNTQKWIVVGRGTAAPMEVQLITPCRKCPRCLRHRARLWTARAITETNTASRTWFGTLTLAPQALFEALTRARRAKGRKGEDYDTLPFEQRFQLLASSIAPDITKYLKRVRAQASAPMRYLLVTESHKSGVPHFHLLVHEVLAEYPIRHAVLTGQWPLGFTNFKLVKPELRQDGSLYSPAPYVAKYLSKSSLARVRASLDYGKPPLVVVGQGAGTLQREKLDLPPRAQAAPRGRRGR